MKQVNAQTTLTEEIMVDCFAGGGGWSTGAELAMGMPVAIAINHDPDAILMHKTNHPFTEHYCESIYDVDPRKAVRGRPVGWAHFSPDCKHFSKAKGGKPVDKKIRGLAWVVLRWAALVRPRVISLENVEEFVTWGPVKRGRPVKARRGETFQRFIAQLEALGYRAEWRELRACDYGAPTIRKRFFLLARCDGKPIVWPTPSHGDPKSPEVQSGKRLPWRSAAEIIDWTLPCPSIFERQRPLAENTLRRVARGMDKFVLKNPSPYLVKFQQNSTGQGLNVPLDTVMAGAARFGMAKPYMVQVNHVGEGFRGQGLHEPLPTLTAKNGHGIATPYLAKYHGEKGAGDVQGQSLGGPLQTVDTSNRYELVAPVMAAVGQTGSNGDRTARVTEPIRTQVTKAEHCLVGATLAHIDKAYSGGYQSCGRPCEESLSTVTATDHNRLVTAQVVKLRGGNLGQAADIPLQTITAGGKHFCVAESFVTKYYGQGVGQGIAEALHTVTSHERYGEVRVRLEKLDGQSGPGRWPEIRSLLNQYAGYQMAEDEVLVLNIGGIDYIMVDIGLRMLCPRELYRAQGFPTDYIIEKDYTGRAYPKSKQVARCGNAVPPPFALALVLANWPERCRGAGFATMAALNEHIAV